MTWNMTEWTDVTSHWVSTKHMRRSWEVTRIPKPERSACLEAFPYYSLPFGVTTRRFRRYNLTSFSLRTLFGHGCFHSIHFSDNTYEFSFPFGKHLWNKTHHDESKADWCWRSTLQTACLKRNQKSQDMMLHDIFQHMFIQYDDTKWYHEFDWKSYHLFTT